MTYKHIDTDALSRLARLELTAEEKARLEDELARFAEFAACLELAIDAAEPSYAPLGDSGAREDEARVSPVSHDELLALSRNAKDGYIAVPMTVDSRGEE